LTRAFPNKRKNNRDQFNYNFSFALSLIVEILDQQPVSDCKSADKNKIALKSLNVALIFGHENGEKNFECEKTFVKERRSAKSIGNWAYTCVAPAAY